MPSAQPTGPRCAPWVKEQGVDPVGTAGSYAGYLLVEWPLPWPHDVSEIPELAPIVSALAGTGLRLQALVPSESDATTRRVIRYSPLPGAGFGGYGRVERLVPIDDVVDVAVALATGAPGEPDHAGAAVTDDVLLCAHGKRDVCCGAFGTALAIELSVGLPAGSAWSSGSVRLWRTSHTGGHRFAPTAIVLPQATMWAFMDADALRRIVARAGPLDDLLPRYRGSPGMGSPALQALEREAFGSVGWEWLKWRRAGAQLDDGRVQITGTSPTGELVRWEATVEVRRQVPVPDCGHPIEMAKKSEPELAVVGLEATT